MTGTADCKPGTFPNRTPEPLQHGAITLTIRFNHVLTREGQALRSPITTGGIYRMLSHIHWLGPVRSWNPSATMRLLIVSQCPIVPALRLINTINFHI